MLHGCDQRFDVTENLEYFLRTKQRLKLVGLGFKARSESQGCELFLKLGTATRCSSPFPSSQLDCDSSLLHRCTCIRGYVSR